MKTDTRKLLRYLQSAQERDAATIETCERMKNADNPQILKMKSQAQAREELESAIIRAIENNDYTDLLTFTKHTANF